jgi:hypothetical protein
MNGLTPGQRDQAYAVARHLCFKVKKNTNHVSGIALNLLQEIGAERFKRAILYQLRAITSSVTGKAPGRDFLSGGKSGTGIDRALQTLLEAAHARLVRDNVTIDYLNYVNEKVDADQFAWACLFSAGDQTTALEDEHLVHVTPNQAELSRQIERMKDRQIPFDEVDNDSEQDEHEPSEEEDDEEVVVEVPQPVRQRRRFH